MAVVAAGEFHDLVAAGEAARQADGGHGGLGAAVAHADLLDGGHELHDELGHLDLVGIGRAETGAVFERGGDGGADTRVVVSVDGRPPGADEVDQLAVVGGDERGAVRGLDEERCAADGAKRADGRVDAAGDELLGAGEERFGGGHGHGAQ